LGKDWGNGWGDLIRRGGVIWEGMGDRGKGRGVIRGLSGRWLEKALMGT
jgi:hypothetical protein